MPNTRDLWLRHKPVIKTDLIAKTITVPVFDYDYPIACMKTREAASNKGSAFTNNTDIHSRTTLTIECWWKPILSSSSITSLFLKEQVLDGNDAILMQAINGTDFNVLIRNSVGTNYNITLSQGVSGLSFGQWNHIAVVYDAVTTNTIKIYINGVLVNTTAITTGQAIATSAGTTPFSILGNRDGGDYITFGFSSINDFRMWSTARTHQQILQRMGTLSSVNAALDVGLIARWTFVELTNPTTILDNLSGLTLTRPANGGLEFTTEDQFPLTFGASWIVSSMEIDIGKKCSLKFPVRPIDSEPDHALMVSWEDANGVIQRRFLYTTPYVDIYTTVVEYRGESLSFPFTLEIWNQDGIAAANRVHSDEELEISLSETTAPTHAADRTAIVAATLAHDNTLSKSYPLTFPITFNELGLYT